MQVKTLYRKTGKREIAHPRQVAFYIARQETDLSYPAIGAKVDLDHTTVIHGVGRVKQRLADTATAQTIGADIDAITKLAHENCSARLAKTQEMAVEIKAISHMRQYVRTVYGTSKLVEGPEAVATPNIAPAVRDWIIL